MRGAIAIANAKVVYSRFREIFYGAPFATLKERGCRVQRPLWASTGVKNPSYRDVLYVEELIGPDTVNTIPPATLDAFRSHGRVSSATVVAGVDEARAALSKLVELGIDLNAIAEELQADGVAAFASAYELRPSWSRTKEAVYSQRDAVQNRFSTQIDWAPISNCPKWHTSGRFRIEGSSPTFQKPCKRSHARWPPYCLIYSRDPIQSVARRRRSSKDYATRI